MAYKSLVPLRLRYKPDEIVPEGELVDLSPERYKAAGVRPLTSDEIQLLIERGAIIEVPDDPVSRDETTPRQRNTRPINTEGEGS